MMCICGDRSKSFFCLFFQWVWYILSIVISVSALCYGKSWSFWQSVGVVLTLDAFSHPVLCRNNPTSPNSHFSFTAWRTTSLLSSFRRDWLLVIKTFICCYNTCTRTHTHTHTHKHSHSHTHKHGHSLTHTPLPLPSCSIALSVLRLSVCPYVIRENLCGKRTAYMRFDFLPWMSVTQILCACFPVCLEVFSCGVWPARRMTNPLTGLILVLLSVCYYVEHCVMEEDVWRQSSACVTQLSQHCCKLHLGNKILYHSIALSYAWVTKYSIALSYIWATEYITTLL